MRRLMVGVAVVAVAVGILVERRSRFATIADRYRSELAELVSRMNSLPPDSPLIKRAGGYGRMIRKYERAARYPWLPVAPDPPEPD